MECFWFLIFGAMPWVVIPALLGLLGKDAQKAAEAWGVAMLLLVVAIIVIVVIARAVS